MKFKEKFDQLKPKHKKIVLWALIGSGIFAFALLSYNGRQQHHTSEDVAQRKEIRLDPDLIQKTMLSEQRQQLAKLRESVEKLEKEQKKATNRQVSKKSGSPDKADSKLPKIPTAKEIAEKNRKEEAKKQKSQRWPRPLSGPGASLAGGQTPPPVEEEVIGDITVLSNPAPDDGVQQESKKKGRTVYLPPSFMEAQLLTGFDASTSGRGRGNPEPVLLRIQTPAVLPNDIKQDLKGCFVIAEAVGRLDKERADVRLVSLSCLSNEGKAVIDTPVKGFVTDSDGKVGLSGHVVSKMGASIARTVLSGFFDGLGEMMKTASSTQSTSALGTTQTVTPSQAGKYALGGGLSEGAKSVHDFYLTLAKQATPVVEVGPEKKITVIISEGKELEIKEIPNEIL